MGTNRPRVQCWIIRVHIIMTAANCSPAVASRRAKYDGDLRVPKLGGGSLEADSLRVRVSDLLELNKALLAGAACKW